jgi:hypothetical protein
VSIIEMSDESSGCLGCLGFLACAVGVVALCIFQATSTGEIRKYGSIRYHPNLSVSEESAQDKVARLYELITIVDDVADNIKDMGPAAYNSAARDRNDIALEATKWTSKGPGLTALWAI